jgi:hypothetical protein
MSAAADNSSSSYALASNLRPQSSALQTIAELGGDDLEVQLALQQLLTVGWNQVSAQEEVRGGRHCPLASAE